MGNDEKFEQQVRATASRLRLVEADFADEDQHSRIGCLSEEIERALKSIVPDKRRAFLQHLMERFPAETFGDEPASQSKPEIEAKLADPDYLVSRLINTLAKLGPEKKASLAEDLREAGLGGHAETGLSDQAMQELRKILKIPGSAEIGVDRLAELVGMLAQFVISLEPLIWRVWKNLSPRSKIRRPQNLNNELGQLLLVDSKGFPGQIELELTTLRRLIVSVLAAIGQVGSQFSRQYVGRFSPSSISALVEMEDTGGYFSKKPEVRCWEKYCELTSHLTEDSVETQMKRIVVDYVESLMEGRDG
ncbi:MAG: hypothetical protein ACYS8Z_15675 [Planctomycetota bacterium]|jgi:hypothetical protein